jgi:RNA polymerase-interacting CarD/CdnL/TRCF family regulator
MPQRGREGMGKRARELARQEKQENKKLRREAAIETSRTTQVPDTAALMEEFHRLSEQRAAKTVSESHYLEERRRIMEKLGIEDQGE